MKNLKKVLALVLAFACAFTMFAGAAFTDAADVNAGNTDAVDMLSALGIIKGYEDGTFRPNATVTRAEMAKMIFTIRNGGSDNADAFKDGVTSFQDVNGTWGAGYIKYCQSMGIIAGKSATRFAPDETVTGTEAAKMLLVTLGYDATNAGLIGNAWASKTKALASEAGLLDGITASLDAAFPRQFAAKIMSNALDGNIVTYNADSKRYDKVETLGLDLRSTGNGNYQWVSVTKNKTMGEQWMKLSTMKGDGNILTRISKESGRETYAVTVAGTTFTRVAKDYANLMGQNVKIMVKDNDTSKVFGIYADSDSKVIATVASGKIEEVTNNTGKVKVDGKEYDLGYKGASYTINEDIVFANNKTAAASTVKSMLDADKTTSKAAEKAFSVKVIDNDGDGKIDRFVTTPVRVGQVTFSNSTSVNVSYKDNMGTATKTFKHADDTIYSGIAKDDWVVVTDKDNTSDGKNVLVKAEKITGDVSALRDNEIKIGDTWYNTVKGLVSDTDITIGKAADLVVVNGYVFSAELSSGSTGDTNVLFVSDVDTVVDGSLGSNDGLLESKVYMSGSNSVVKVSKINGVKLAKGSTVPAIKNMMFTYSKNSSGNYELTQLSETKITNGGIRVNGVATDLIKNMAGYSDLDNSVTFSNKKIDGVTIADDAVIFVKAKDSVKALSGKTVKNWSVSSFGQSGMSLVKKSNGINYVKVACLTDERVDLPGGSADGKSYAFLTSKPTRATYEGETAVQLPLWNGESLTAYIDNTSVPDYLTDARLVVYEMDGKYVKVDSTDMDKVAPVAITGFENTSEGQVTFVYGNGGANRTYAMNKDCVYIAVNGRDGVTGASREAIPTTDVNNGKYMANAWVYTSGDQIYAIAYDVDNELDTLDTFTA